MRCYAVGMYHPGPRRHIDPDPFNLTADQLANMSLVGYPVTLEHVGIDDAAMLLAVANVPETARTVSAALRVLSDGDCYKAPVGVVLDNGAAVDGRWYCLMAIDRGLTAVKTMIEIGALRGLSLTHRVAASPVPLEMSLCCHPARRGCYVQCLVDNINVAREYMRLVITGALTMENAAPTLSDIVDNLPDEQRAIMQSSIKALVEQVNEAKATAKMSDTAARAQKTNNALLTNQIGMMTNMMSDEIRETFYCTPKQLLEDMASGDLQTVLGTTERLICAANRQMMELKADANRSTRKRKASTAMEATASALPDDDLARGIAETFGYTI